MTIEDENLTGHLRRHFCARVQHFVQIEQSYFLKNTVKYGLIKVLNLSYLDYIKLYCYWETMLKKDGAAIYAYDKSHQSRKHPFPE